MWFKQLQLFEFSSAIRCSTTDLQKSLQQFMFQECLPSMSYTLGWVSPIDEPEAPLVITLNNYSMICLQIEEKILPALVVRQALAKKVAKIEELESRKLSQKEKYVLKDDITAKLLQQAFSKISKIYAYFDLHHKRLILGTANAKSTEKFISAFTKTFGNHINPLEIKNISSMMTSWLQHQNYSSSFSIEKSCVLQDANHQGRIIRCKEQDLFSNNIQSFIKEGCEVKQLAMNWQDRVDFSLLDDLSIQSIRFHDEVIAETQDNEPGSLLQKFSADFIIMTEALNALLKELLDSFAQPLAKTG